MQKVMKFSMALSSFPSLVLLVLFFMMMSMVMTTSTVRLVVVATTSTTMASGSILRRGQGILPSAFSTPNSRRICKQFKTATKRTSMATASCFQVATVSSATTTRMFSTIQSSSTDTFDNDSEQDTTTTTVVTAPRKFVPKPFEYHQEIELRIDSLTNMGWGIGRISLDETATMNDIDVSEDTQQDNEDGNSFEENTEEPKNQRQWVVMVPHVVVGELVKVRIFRNQRNFSEADLIEVIEASPHRVTPKCSLAGECGGCQYQHMSIEAQRDWKTQHVQEVLWQQQIKGYSDTAKKQNIHVLPTMGTEHVFGYRSKITPHYQAPREVGIDQYEIDEIGFQRSSNRNLIDVPECPIATDAINEKYKQRRTELFQQAKDGALGVKKAKGRRSRNKKKGGSGLLGATLLFRHADDDKDGNPVVITDHNEYMTTTVKGLKFRYLAGNFFQNNNYVLPLMVDAVIDAATRPISTASGVDEKPSYLIDCYCGSGLFALSAASQFDLCVGIEVNDKAVEEATANANLNGITNCQFMAASAEAIFTSPPALKNGRDIQVKDFPRDQTVVVLDPPRKGCSTEFLEQLYEYSPERVVYMSCGPATQARDAKGIVEIGGYDIVSVQPFDLFPQTKHIECLIVFEKKKRHDNANEQA